MKQIKRRLVNKTAMEAVEFFCTLAGRSGSVHSGLLNCNYCGKNPIFPEQLVVCSRISACKGSCCRRCFQMHRLADVSCVFPWYAAGENEDYFEDVRWAKLVFQCEKILEILTTPDVGFMRVCRPVGECGSVWHARVFRFRFLRLATKHFGTHN